MVPVAVVRDQEYICVACANDIENTIHNHIPETDFPVFPGESFDSAPECAVCRDLIQVTLTEDGLKWLRDILSRGPFGVEESRWLELCDLAKLHGHYLTECETCMMEVWDFEIVRDVYCVCCMMGV